MAGIGDSVIERFTAGGFGENGYVLRCAATGAGILVDPGACVGQMLEAVSQHGVDVRAIVLTHAHIDHIEGVAEAKLACKVPVYLHPDDVALYGQAQMQAEWFGIQLGTLPPIDEFLRVGTPVRFGECALEVRHTPGHAPGHVALVGDGFALIGDCVFAGSIGRTDLPGGDFQTLMRSIRTEILSLPDETVLYAGHGDETTVGHERVSNPFLAPQLGGSSYA